MALNTAAAEVNAASEAKTDVLRSRRKVRPNNSETKTDEAKWINIAIDFAVIIVIRFTSVSNFVSVIDFKLFE